VTSARESDASECLAAAGFPASEVKAWLQAEPGETTDFPADREKFSEYWRISARLLGRLPLKPRRNASEDAAAHAIQDAARNARVAVAMGRGHERSGIEQNRISAPYPGAARAILRW